MSRETKLSTRVLAAIGELATIAALFPYQITVNRKEKSFGIRSFLISVKSERKENEEGKKSTVFTLNMPGFAFDDAKKSLAKRFPKPEKKKRRLIPKKKEESED